MIRSLILGLSLLVGLPALAWSQEQGAITPEIHKEHTLGPGDIISVHVWKQPDLTQQMTIGPGGKINFPLIGTVTAQGLTVQGLGDVMRSRLSQHLRVPQVTVSLVKLNSFRVYVTGEVLKPDVYVVNGTVTAVQAIAMAGGFTPFASRKDIIILKEGAESQRIVFNYDKFVQKGKDNPVLQSGDTIIVK